MNKQRLKQLIAAMAFAGFIAPVSAHAQNGEANQATTLAIEAIEAKEAGDLATSRAKLEQYLQLNPADEAAKELLTEVKKAILSGQPLSAPAKPATALDRIAEENLTLFREIEVALIDAQNRAAAGNFDEAILLLDQAVAALPNNTAGQAQKEKISLVRQSIVAGRESRDNGGVKRLAAEAIAAETRLSNERIAEARSYIRDAASDIGAARYEDASAKLAKAATVLPTNATAELARIELTRARAKLAEAQYITAVENRDMKAAGEAVDAYIAIVGSDDRRGKSLRADYEEKKGNPHFKSIKDISPEFYAREKEANEALARGRAQYLYGDYLGALETYKAVTQLQPYNTEAKAMSIRIRDILHTKSGAYNLHDTKAKLLEEVDAKWLLAEAYSKEAGPTTEVTVIDPVIARMKTIVIPSANLKEMKLDRVIETLGELSFSYDKEQKGVNFVVIDPEKRNPDVSLTLRDMTLDRVLEQVLRSVNFTYSVNNGVIEIRPDSGVQDTETEFLPLSRQSLTRMTGVGAAVTTNNDPFGTTGGADSGSPEVDGLKRYFRSAGIEFAEDKGQGIGYDGNQIIVTHNLKTIERIRNIVRRYSDVKQVAIETKFIEVTQGTLNQIAANWTMTNMKTVNGVETTQLSAATGNRTTDSAFRTNATSSQGSITTVSQSGGTLDPFTGQLIGQETIRETTPIPGTAPLVPGLPNYGGSNNIGAFGNPAPSSFLGTFSTSFGIGGYDANLFIQAIEQSTGSDLMAAPSLTVASGTTATIKIAQLLRYPESYSQIQSQVSSGGGWGGNNNNGGGGGNASVAITAGTPQDFVEREVGVVMEVVPTVSEDGGSIDLDLKPKITEFEGFVEYGGTSVAIAGTTTVTVPSGFYQPIFSIREVITKVTVYDGSTVVIGGLTREEVKTVHDKVPVLGDLPIFGKLFQSNGKTATKKNLMIFVTANMISPTGSNLRNTVGGIPAGTSFQNPTVSSPSGPLYRSPAESRR